MSKTKTARVSRPATRASRPSDDVVDLRSATPIPPSGRAAEVAETPVARTKYARIKVRATRDGYYDDKYLRAGDVFTIDGEPLRSVLKREQPAAKGVDQDRLDQPAAFSTKWMERVGKDTPEQITSHNAALRRKHDEELAARAGARNRAASAPDGEDNPIGAED